MLVKKGDNLILHEEDGSKTYCEVLMADHELFCIGTITVNKEDGSTSLSYEDISFYSNDETINTLAELHLELVKDEEPEESGMLVKKGDVLIRQNDDGSKTLHEVIVADDDLFCIGNGPMTYHESDKCRSLSYDKVWFYSNDKTVNTLDDLHLELIKGNLDFVKGELKGE